MFQWNVWHVKLLAWWLVDSKILYQTADLLRCWALCYWNTPILLDQDLLDQMSRIAGLSGDLISHLLHIAGGDNYPDVLILSCPIWGKRHWQNHWQMLINKHTWRIILIPYELKFLINGFKYCLPFTPSYQVRVGLHLWIPSQWEVKLRWITHLWNYMQKS